jgi:hypothetical protein
MPSYAQTDNPGKTSPLELPSRLLDHIQRKTASLDQALSTQSEKFLTKMARREALLQKRLNKIDPEAARRLFGESGQQYAALAEKARQDTGSKSIAISGDYQPYIDSLRVSLRFMQENPQFFSSPARLQQAAGSLQGLEAKMQDADQVKELIRQREQQIGDYISRHSDLQGLLGKQYLGMKKDLYYYSQQARQYKEMLNHPDQMELQALSLLNKVPAFQAFMKQNSQLSALFSLPANYGSPEALSGLQAKDQVSALIQNRVATGGAGGAAALQGNLQAAEGQLNGYKDKLSRLGSGSGDIDLPDFKPNDQKTKTFWKRLEYGTNFQTTHNSNYYPTISDIGLSVGYRISDANTMGIGASYKVGWGNGFNHIALSSQGVGFRWFLDMRIKGSFYASGGFEYNHRTPFRSVQDLRSRDEWTSSGLVGISKIVSLKSRVFKKTKLQLLWDLLSYRQVPRTQALLFRVGYSF